MKNHLQGIDTIIVRVKSLTRSKEWYVEKMGLAPEWHDEILNLVVLNTGSPTSLTLWQTEAPVVASKDGSCYPIFRTPDARLAHAALSLLDVKVDPVISDHAVTYFRFYDPDGNVLEACQVH